MFKFQRLSRLEFTMLKFKIYRALMPLAAVVAVVVASGAGDKF